VQLAETSGAVISQLVPSIRTAADLVHEVAAASSEQAIGVEQMNKSMTRVDELTQRNAAAAEELASTSEELAAQAETLQQLIGFFKVNGADRSAAAQPAPSRFGATLAVKKDAKNTPAAASARRIRPRDGAPRTDGDFTRF
jgi:methyl-accepting chemotaxis protein